MQIPCVYIPGPAPAVSVANRTYTAVPLVMSDHDFWWLYMYIPLSLSTISSTDTLTFCPHDDHFLLYSMYNRTYYDLEPWEKNWPFSCHIWTDFFYIERISNMDVFFITQ
jgi:hypothetical protein